MSDERNDSELEENLMRFRVVAAFIRDQGTVLLTQRWPGKRLGLTWEFPGGKVESGESDEQALKRELKEELGVDIAVGSPCFETCHGYGNREVHLIIYRCKITRGAPQAIDVKAVEWVEQTDIANREFPPADLLFVQELMAGRVRDYDELPAEEDKDEDEIEFKPAQVVRKL